MRTRVDGCKGPGRDGDVRREDKDAQSKDDDAHVADVPVRGSIREVDETTKVLIRNTTIREHADKVDAENCV